MRFGPGQSVAIPFAWTHDGTVELKVVATGEGHATLAETEVVDEGYDHRFGASVAVTDDDVVLVRDVSTDAPLVPGNEGFAAFEATRHGLAPGLPLSDRFLSRMPLNFRRSPTLHPRSPATTPPANVRPLGLDAHAIRGLLYVYVHERAEYEIEAYGPWNSGVGTLIRGPIDCP